MQLGLICHDCADDMASTVGKATVHESAYFHGLITTDDGAIVHCPRGHTFCVYVQDGSYALLYERALERLAKGSTRDAVLDAYTVLEMYLAHVPVRARYDREQGASTARIREELALVLKTSERAMAAALMAASAAGRCAPPKIPSRFSELRNRAVHGGVYPTVEDAEQLCLGIADLVFEFEDLLDKQTCANAASYGYAMYAERCVAWRTRIKRPELREMYISAACVLDATRETAERLSAKERLDGYRSGTVSPRAR